MAKLEGNPMGGFRGKLGNLVGYSWKGVWCVRSRPAAMRNPRTEAQQRHRAMFAEEVRLAGRMSWALNIGLGAVADELHMTPCNAFVKANQQAFGAEGDNTLTVDWEQLIISAGPVAPIQLGVPEISDEGVLTVTFEKNPYLLRANNFDQVHLYVYCPGMSQGHLAAPVYRKDRRISVSLPDAMQGQELHLYAFVTDEQGRASDTSYASPMPKSPPIQPQSIQLIQLIQNPQPPHKTKPLQNPSPCSCRSSRPHKKKPRSGSAGLCNLVANHHLAYLAYSVLLKD